MIEPTLKRIQYDTFTVDFVEKDGRTYLHFYDNKNDKSIDEVIKKYFFYNLQDTGKLIEESLDDFAPEVRYLDFSKKKLLENTMTKEMTDREKEIQSKYEDLQNLYDEKGIIHKSLTFNLFSSNLDKKIYSYIIPEINPFIDEIMLRLSEDLDKDLNKL